MTPAAGPFAPLSAGNTAPITAEPTPEQLRLAYRAISRPSWPPLELALQHDPWRTCLRALARNLGRARWQPAPMAPGLPRGPSVPPDPPAPASRTRAASPITSQWSRRRGIDCKRAAANDLDDLP